jgi:hypothetical protein
MKLPVRIAPILAFKRIRGLRRLAAMMLPATILGAAGFGLLTAGAPAQAAPMAAIVRPVASGLSIGEAAARLSPHLPWLLGMDGPRTYLVLIQNNHELRPTGGFIAAVGRVTLEGGKLAGIDFVDSYKIFSDKSTYPAAPRPMQTHMGIPLLVMRDANWSPDLPTTAQVARALYAQDAATHVDGIVTVDLNAVKHMMGALGSLEVPGADEPITRENIEEQVIRFWERPVDVETTIESGWNAEWFAQRKEFIPAIARAALDQIQQGNTNLALLFSAAQAALDDRSIQVWVNKPEVQAVLSEARWDGGLRPPPASDFLAVIDTNMGYNKVDAALQRELEYRVEWPDGADQPAIATLVLTYTHPIDAEDPGCDLTPRYGTTYADMIARCYFDYLRVYVPAGSKLLQAEGVNPESLLSREGEQDTQEIAGYFVLSPNEQRRVVFTYQLPPAIKPDSYRLMVQRQSGTGPLPVTLGIDGVDEKITLSSGWLEWQLPQN